MLSPTVVALLLVALPGKPGTAGGIDFEAARRHWAYQPITPPQLPVVADREWATSPIDRFVLAKLEAAGLTPSPRADRRTLIRRVTFDLIGLPPPPEEVQAFVDDPSPDAYSRLVDRLLGSPHYGERWGRHWLDVAHYSDTKDLVLTIGEDSIRPYAYTYRDYVIRAFNRDLPFDQFVHEQLAADKLREEKPRSKLGPWKLAAMGFLTLGPLYADNPHDIFDDRIDTVTRAFLGLTVSCARCHDHKYDAIPIEDYYALYGVFASSERPLEQPLIDDPKNTPGSAEFQQEYEVKMNELLELIDSQYKAILETARMRTTDYLLRVATQEPDFFETATFFRSLSPDDLKPKILRQWREYLERHSHQQHPVFGPWNDLMELPENELAERSGEILARWRKVEPGTAPRRLNPLVAEALETTPMATRADVARVYGELFKSLYKQSKESEVPAVDPGREQLLTILTGTDGPNFFLRTHTHLHMSRQPRNDYDNMILAVDQLAVKKPGAPPRAMVLVDAADLYDPRVFVRGDPNQPGESVSRRFLSVLGGAERGAFANGSGRLDLARAITAADNPLTSRVLVNRVWMHHFGEPLVRTPSDFGVRCDPPTHPELLDKLAWTFTRDGWSLKRLHRNILLSSAYQQSSRDRPECRRVDPANRLLWRAHRRRLDVESMRDALLAIADQLDRSLLGRPVALAAGPINRRRTLYGLIDRQDLSSLLRAFDFADPVQSCGRRAQTTVPQQALFAMNSAFVIEQAKALAARKEIADQKDPRRRVASIYQRVLTREPEDEEVDSALRFIEAAAAETSAGKNSELGAWEQLAQILLLTNEFLFVD